VFRSVALVLNGVVKNDDISEKTEETLANIGKNIRSLRKSKGWTQEQLAEKAGINDKEVSHIEQGRRNITIETLIKISSSLGLPPSSLLDT
jgi:transcriptional regulator with XRE-family HTH domain